MTKYSEINVPVDLCSYVLKYRKCRELRLLILLKLHCDGTLNLKNAEYGFIRKTFFGSERTFKRHLKSLIELKWVWINHKRNILHLESFDKILLSTKNKNRRRVTIHLDHLREKSSFTALCMSAVIGSLINQSKKGVQKKAERTSGRSIIPLRASFNYFGYGVRRIAELTGRSIGNVHMLKKVAEEFGFLTSKNKREPFEILGKTVHIKQLGEAKKANPSLANRIWPYKGYVWISNNDEIIPHLHFTSRRIRFDRIHSQKRSKQAINKW